MSGVFNCYGGALDAAGGHGSLTPLNGPNNSSFDPENNQPVVAGTDVLAGGTLNGFTLTLPALRISAVGSRPW